MRLGIRSSPHASAPLLAGGRIGVALIGGALMWGALMGCTQLDLVTLGSFCDQAGAAAEYCEDFDGDRLREGGLLRTTSAGRATLELDAARASRAATLELLSPEPAGHAMLVSGDVAERPRFRASYMMSLELVPEGESLLLDQARTYPEPTYNVEFFALPGSLMLKEILPSSSPPFKEHYPAVPRAFPPGWARVEHWVDLEAGTTEVWVNGESFATAQLSEQRSPGKIAVSFGIVYASGAGPVTIRLDDVLITSQ